MNLRYGRSIQYGKKIWASPVSSGTGPSPGSDIIFVPNAAQIVAYNPDGTKAAIFGNNTEEQSFHQIQFEIINTGCGQATLTFKKYPSFSKIFYGQRIDIHLYGDRRPWWSGYVLDRPDSGGTETDYKIVCHGFYNALTKKQIFGRYQNWEISQIVIDICRQAEAATGVIVNTSKIYNTSYVVSDIIFDGLDVQECLKQLSEFAVDWVYGVDEYRQFFFKPRVEAINEEARFWVGVHIKEYLPTVNADKIVNWARIKGSKMDDSGEQWLSTVEDTASQAEYGRREAVWTLPSAYSETDAERWGLSEIRRYKDPIPSAKVKGISLEYARPDKNFWVRKLNTDGQAAITNKEGELKTYPITKLKYTISADKGINLEMELGEQPFIPEKYLKDIERENKNNELLQQASNRQLKG